MPLPRGDEYNQAIQSPVASFTDIDLKRGQVETTPLGLPKPYSGGFTTTYRLTSGGSSWAVRCFTREIKDLQRRYQSITNFQNANNCSFLVPARYLHNGIKVNGNYYPIIKMKWLDGDPLNLYIDKHYQQKSIIENLLNEFVNLIKRLENYGIAHGDLQHGNILVKGGKLHLIDYDGMFLRDISNFSVNELGHPNFQHPRRSSSDYNKDIDRFSACVIYTALKAISISPSLWKKYDNGDNLLFKGQDFINPQGSQLFSQLSNFSELNRLTKNLTAICSLGFNSIPKLDGFINSTITSSTIILPPISGVRSAYRIIDGTQKGQLLEHIGEKVEVVGKLTASYKGITQYGNPYVFLNIGQYPSQTFTIVIWSEGLAKLKENEVSVSSLMNKWISITGVLSSFDGKPQMTLELPNQLHILRSESAGQAKLSYTKNPSSSPATARYKQTSTLKEEDVFNKLYRNREATPPPKTNISYSGGPQKVIPRTIPSTQRNNPQPFTPYKPVSKPKSSVSKAKTDNIGCTLSIVLGIIGAMLLGNLTESEGGVFIGFIIGGIIGTMFTKS